MSSPTHNNSGNANGTNGHGARQATSQPRAVAKYRNNWLPQRERPSLTADEQLGDHPDLGDFTDVPTLSISEANLLIEAVHEKRQRDNVRWQDTDITQKMMSYMDVFSRFKSREQIREVEMLFRPYPHITYWEKSQLMTLCPGEWEEAFFLVPSLKDKISEGEAKQLIEDMNQIRTV